jgi:heme-degrading monooxygenase HmoA
MAGVADMMDWLEIRSGLPNPSRSAAASETCGAAMRLQRSAFHLFRSGHSSHVWNRAQQEAPMPEIRESNGICTQINVVKLPADKQDEVVKLMIERARFMATQPGFVSVNLHRSKDGSHLVNYVQWTSAEKLAAAHHAPEFRKKWPQFGEMVREADPCLYDVVHVEAA